MDPVLLVPVILISEILNDLSAAVYTVPQNYFFGTSFPLHLELSAQNCDIC